MYGFFGLYSSQVDCLLSHWDWNSHLYHTSLLTSVVWKVYDSSSLSIRFSSCQSSVDTSRVSFIPYSIFLFFVECTESKNELGEHCMFILLHVSLLISVYFGDCCIVDPLFIPFDYGMANELLLKSG